MSEERGFGEQSTLAAEDGRDATPEPRLAGDLAWQARKAKVFGALFSKPVGLANVALAKHRPKDALPLAERALAIHENAGVPATLLASTRFLLARALWDAPADAGRDRPRAVALAEQARDALRETGAGSAKDLAEVEAWLAEHRLP